MEELKISKMYQTFGEQKEMFNENCIPTYISRIKKLTLLKNEIINNKDEIINALSKDFGHRSNTDSIIADIMPSISAIKYCIKNLKKWMCPSKRKSNPFIGSPEVNVYYRPLGVVGIVVPWNFPLALAIVPLAYAISAGNNAMIKMSEYSPETTKLLNKIMSKCFDQNNVAIIDGNEKVAEEFSKIPFNHLFFTGSTEVGKRVMSAAANNLTPVTLELGGKSPVIIDDEISIDLAVERIILGKCMNAGQICVAPDYILLPEHKIEDFIFSFKERFKKLYDNDQAELNYTSIINGKQYQRLFMCLDDAKNKGANIIDIDNSNSLNNSNTKKMAPKLVTNVSDDMKIMKEEIFGPILPIIGYSGIDEAIYYINKRPSPLACYLMSFNKKLHNKIIDGVRCGGMSINDTIVHVSIDDAPFGGIGHSGMGKYHGKEGFLTFSHAKTVLKRGKFYPMKFLFPPINKFIMKLINRSIK